MDGMKQLEKGTLTKTGEPKVVITKLSSEEVSSNRYEILISSAVTRYLSARKLAWPIEYTADDLVAPWLDPSSFLLFINIAEPYREIEEEFIQDGKLLSRMKRVPMPPEDILLKIDEKNIEVIPAFNGVYSYVIRTFLGFYVDISDLALDQPHEIELVLPNDLKEVQFQGIFTHNVRSTQK